MHPSRALRALAATAALAALAAGLWAPPAAAHHGWSGYSEKAERFAGVIRAVDYANPHVTIQLEAGDTTWRVVLAPPSRMERRGLPKGALTVGAAATVEAYRHEGDRAELRAEWIELGDKRTELR
jgi:hypothetical protein